MSRRTYVGRIYLGEDADGKQLYHWVGRFPTKRERDEAVRKARAKLDAGHGDLPASDEYVDSYLSDYRRTHKGSSYDTQRQRLQRFRKDFAGRSLDISRAEAKDWVNGENRWAAKGPVSPGTVQAVVTLFNYAIDEDDLPLARNPFRKLGKRTKGRSEEAPPTEGEFAVLLDACAALGDYGPQMRAFLNFSAFTLMRPSEVMALEWGDIDMNTMRIQKARRVYRGTIDTPKTGEKLIALTPPARDALLGLASRSEGGLVFRSIQGKRLSAPVLSGYWGKVLARAQMDFALYLATKHFGVWSLWTKYELSPRAIAAQAGWSMSTVNKMLAIYGHSDVGALEEVDAAGWSDAEVVPLRAVGK